jgi:DNA-binding Lrp family transcriptional regulator
MKKFLVKIKKTNPNFPLAESISKLECCQFVDTVSGEIDGIAKISANEEELKNLIERFDIKKRYIEQINLEYNFKNFKEKKNNFWINFKIKKRDILKLEDFMAKCKNLYEAYLTDKSIYIRGGANLIEDVDKIWTDLYNQLNSITNTKTYFVFKRF